MRENIKWEKIDEITYYLYSTPFYDDEHIATLSIKDGDIYMHIQKNNDDVEDFICDYVDDSSIDYAKREIIDTVELMIEDMANYYKAIYDSFMEGEDDE